MAPPSQKIDKLFLDGVELWNQSDPDSPSDIENWISAGLTIADATTGNFVVEFQDPLEPGTYDVHIVVIDPAQTKCQVSQPITLP